MNTAAEGYAQEAKAIFDGADMEQRDLTPEERGQFETLLAKSRQARSAERAEARKERGRSSAAARKGS